MEELKDINEVKTEEEARQIAINFQQWQSEQSLSYEELAYFGNYFQELANKFNLVEEFKENAII